MEDMDIYENRWECFGETLERVLEQSERIRKQDYTINGLTTGFPGIDQWTTGLHPGDLIMIAARPYMGKTAIAVDIMRHVAIKEEVPVAFFSFKKSREELARLLLAMEADVAYLDLKSGKVMKKDQECKKRIEDAPIIINDCGCYDMKTIRKACWELKNKYSVELVIIDALTFLCEIGGISKEYMGLILKLFARELDLPVIFLMDAPREVDFRSEHRLGLFDFSHELMDSVDIAIFPYRDGIYHPGLNWGKPVVMEMIFGKNKYGLCGTQYVLFDRSKHYVVDHCYTGKG